MRRVTIAAALITSGLLAGACGTAHTLGPASAPRGVLTIANAGNSPWTCGFNPFNGSATSLSLRLGRTGQVVMTFKRPAVPYFYYIADDVPVVPRHIWSKIAHPAAYADAHPVGTGAFLLQSCTKKDIVYTANRRYWMPGEPRIAT